MGRRPDGTTMEGMIWNANHVLETALDPTTPFIPREMFANAVGIVLISVVEAGFIFSGNVGTGVIMAKGKDGKWSPPSAIGLLGVGYGFLVGGAVKDVIIFITDQGTMNSYTAGDIHIKAGARANITLGPVGRDANASLDVNMHGGGGTISIAFSKGAFVGASLEGATLSARGAVNADFYGKSASPREILFSEGAVEIPEHSLIPDLHQKLTMLADGKSAIPSQSESQKVEAAKVEAEQAAERAKSVHEDIVFVEAAKEAEKEVEKEKEAEEEGEKEATMEK